MQITFFSKKDQRDEMIMLEPTEDGWYMSHECYQGHTDPSGEPQLRKCMEDNYTPIPPAFSDAFEEIWTALKFGKITEQEAQDRFDKFSNWLKAYTLDSSVRLTDVTC